MLYSSFRPFYLCTFPSDKSCLTEGNIQHITEIVTVAMSHITLLFEKSSLAAYFYFYIEFLWKMKREMS